jgi:hypothetical protein
MIRVNLTLTQLQQIPIFLLFRQQFTKLLKDSLTRHLSTSDTLHSTHSLQALSIVIIHTLNSLCVGLYLLVKDPAEAFQFFYKLFYRLYALLQLGIDVELHVFVALQ